MKVDVEVDARRREIELTLADGVWRVSVDGCPLAVDVAGTSSGWSVLTASRSHEVGVRERAAGELTVTVDGEAFDVAVLDPRAYRRRDPATDRASTGGIRQVIAPMPGRVVRVLVKAGERVSARQGLIVIEAMRMENELRAPADAIVRDVRATEGASVEAGAVLLVLE